MGGSGRPAPGAIVGGPRRTVMGQVGIRARVGAFASAAMALVLAAGHGVAQVPLQAGAAEATIGGQFQLQALTSSCSGFPLPDDSVCEEQVPALDWFIRRARLKLDVTIDERIDGRFQAEISDPGGLAVADAWGRLLLNPAARLTIGRFKRPFDGFQMTSSARFLTIERDLDIPGVPGFRAASLDELTTRFRVSGRDVGFMLDGATPEGGFRYWLGTFTGSGPDEAGDLNTEKQVVARGQVALRAAGRPLAIAAAGALTDVPFTAADGALDGRYFGAGELWTEWGDFAGGPHLQAGVVLGANPLQNRAGAPLDLSAGEEFARMWTFQAIGSYRFEVPAGFDDWIRAVEPVFRVTRAEPNTRVGGDENWGLTPGVQLFLAGDNKFALNWDLALFTAEDLRVEHSLKVQYQLFF